MFPACRHCFSFVPFVQDVCLPPFSPALFRTLSRQRLPQFCCQKDFFLFLGPLIMRNIISPRPYEYREELPNRNLRHFGVGKKFFLVWRNRRRGKKETAGKTTSRLSDQVAREEPRGDGEKGRRKARGGPGKSYGAKPAPSQIPKGEGRGNYPPLLNVLGPDGVFSSYGCSTITQCGLCTPQMRTDRHGCSVRAIWDICLSGSVHRTHHKNGS